MSHLRSRYNFEFVFENNILKSTISIIFKKLFAFSTFGLAFLNQNEELLPSLI